MQRNLHKPSRPLSPPRDARNDNLKGFRRFVATYSVLVAQVVGGRLHEIIIAPASFTVGM